MKKNNKINETPCPCESGKNYDTCCRPFIDKQCDPSTAVALMRSRYTAFTRGHETYLRYSWHPDYCPEDIHLNAETNWLGLKIINAVAGKQGDSTGEVEFIARNKTNGKAHRIHENSQFILYQSHWVYTTGENTRK